MAAWRSNCEALTLLLKEGADVNSTNLYEQKDSHLHNTLINEIKEKKLEDSEIMKSSEDSNELYYDIIPETNEIDALGVITETHSVED